jgi:iron complex transport system substrate-binding protein
MQKENSKRPSSLFFIAIGLVAIGLLLIWVSNPGILNREQEEEAVVTVYSCEEPVTFESIPQRAISMDTNMTEMMLALGLEDQMVGYWISGVEVGEEFQDQIEGLELISDVLWPPPSMEVILSFDPDFVFGAWEYNFSEESGVNPQKLEQAGVKTYVLSESCVATGVKPNEFIDSTYDDILNLGKIFKVEDRAQELVDEMKGNIQEVQEKIGDIERPLRGFYYGGGADAAFTAGKYAMVTKMMKSVGAENILGDVEDDWIPSAGWETIIERDPEFIMIDDTPWESAQARIDTLESLPQLESITAIQEKIYIVFPWTYILPGMQMDNGITLLASELYPDKF